MFFFFLFCFYVHHALSRERRMTAEPCIIIAFIFPWVNKESYFMLLYFIMVSVYVRRELGGGGVAGDLSFLVPIKRFCGNNSVES